MIKEVKNYINIYKPILKLDAWTIIVVFKESDDNYLQVIFESLEYKVARIEISQLYSELTKEEREESVVHELSHIILQPFEDIHGKFIDQLIEFYNKLRVQVNEQTTEHYAQAMMNMRYKK